MSKQNFANITSDLEHTPDASLRTRRSWRRRCSMIRTRSTASRFIMSCAPSTTTRVVITNDGEWWLH